MSYDKELIAHKLIRWEHYLNNYKLPAWKELPDIGLYMDQVIALLGQYLDFIPMEDSKDKPVTPTTASRSCPPRKSASITGSTSPSSL